MEESDFGRWISQRSWRSCHFCLTLHGTIVDTRYLRPPAHRRCRCRVRMLTVDEAIAAGVMPAPRPPIPGRPPPTLPRPLFPRSPNPWKPRRPLETIKAGLGNGA